MDSEVSLIMANQVLASNGKVIWDPFGSFLFPIFSSCSILRELIICFLYLGVAGTGSMLLTCSQFGALTIGGDIDPKQLRGKGKLLLPLLLITQRMRRY